MTRASQMSVLIGLIGSIIGSYSDISARNTSERGVQVIDDLSRSVRLTQPAVRIASLSPAVTEILFAVGCGEAIVLRDKASDYPPSVRVVPATDPFQFPLDHIAGFKPDLILTGAVAPEQLAATRRLGLRIASFNPGTVGAMLDVIRRVGQLCGAGEEAKQLVQSLQTRVSRVQQRVRQRDQPTVYVEVDGSDPLRPWTASRGSFVHDLLTLVKAKNIARALGRPYLQIGVEKVLEADPQYILVCSRTTPERAVAALASRPGWSMLSAIKQGKIIANIDPDLLVRPGPRLVDGLELLADQLHGPAAR